MLTFTFLGVGGAFARCLYQSNVLIEAWSRGPKHQQQPDDVLLVDFGATGPGALYALSGRPGFSYLRCGGRINYAAIRGVFVTHQHADHVGGLEDLAFASMFDPDADRTTSHKPELIGDTRVLGPLWDRTLRGGMEAAPGRLAVLEDYFTVRSLDHRDPQENRFYIADRYRAEPFPTDHIRIHAKYDWPSFGLTIADEASGASVFFSGDTRFDFDAHAERLKSARVAFHDVHLDDYPDPVHALLSELTTLPESIKRKTYLYHYADDWDEPRYRDALSQFAGPARQHVRYEVLP